MNNKGQSLIHLVIGVGAGLTAFFMGWNSWLSITTIAIGNNMAAINQHLKDLDDNYSNQTKLFNDHWRIGTTTAKVND